MALSDNRRQRTVMLCAMYLAQGIPWGFMVTSVAAYLAEHGVDDAEIANLIAAVMYPWTFKLVWAPIMDSLTVRSMGRRRPWIIGAELLMAASLLALMTVDNLEGQLETLKWMFFMHNVFASLQDVCTDALAVDILPPEEQGRVNGLMWGWKLVGKGVGGAGLAWVISVWSFQAAIMVQFAILMGIMLFPIMLLERPGEKRMPWSQGQAGEIGPGGNIRGLSAIFRDLFTGFSILTTSAYAIYATIHVAGWGIVEVISKPVYTQRIKWTFVDYSYVEGWSIFPQLFGAIIGGWLCDRLGRKTIMFSGFGTYGLMAIVFGMFPQMWEQNWFATGYLLCSPGILALGSVGFLSMGMKLSWTTSAATMFTVFMTLSNVGHVIGTKITGYLRADLDLSHEETFITAGIVMCAPMLLLLCVRPKKIEEAEAKISLAALDGQPTIEETTP